MTPSTQPVNRRRFAWYVNRCVDSIGRARLLAGRIIRRIKPFHRKGRYRAAPPGVGPYRDVGGTT